MLPAFTFLRRKEATRAGQKGTTVNHSSFLFFILLCGWAKASTAHTAVCSIAYVPCRSKKKKKREAVKGESLLCMPCEQHVFPSFSFSFDTPSTLDEVSTSNAAGPFYSVCVGAFLFFFLRRLSLITIIDKLRKKKDTPSRSSACQKCRGTNSTWRHRCYASTQLWERKNGAVALSTLRTCAYVCALTSVCVAKRKDGRFSAAHAMRKSVEQPHLHLRSTPSLVTHSLFHLPPPLPCFFQLSLMASNAPYFTNTTKSAVAQNAHQRPESIKTKRERNSRSLTESREDM